MALLATAVAPGQATSGTGSIRGIVSDPTGAGLAGAKVILTNKATAGVVERTTSSSGSYSSGPLQPGDYTLRVEAKGFQAAVFPVVAQVGVSAAVDVKVQVSQEHPVVAIPPGTALNTEQAAVQSVLPGRQIENLPISGRAVFDFAQLEPGIQLQDGSVLFPGKNGFSSISFVGRFGRTAQVEVDGVGLADETIGATTQNVPSGAIHELNLSQSTLDLSTELTSSGAVNIATRSGGNELHGEAFGWYRGDQGAAALPGSKGMSFQQPQFGGQLGGALIKDKLFWFLDGEHLKRDLTAGVPFAAPFDQLGDRLVQPFRETQGDGRLDWQVHNNAHAFLRFIYDENSQVRPYGAASSLQAFKSESHTPSVSLGYDFNTGSYLHSIRFGYLRFRNDTVDNTATIPAGINNPIPGLGINIGAPVHGNCALSGGGAYCGGPSAAAQQSTTQSNYEFRYDGTRMMGNHIIRYGALWDRIHAGRNAALYSDPQVGTTFANGGQSDPTSYAADYVFLGNGVGVATAQSAFGEPGGGLGPDNRLEAYVGDAWRIKRNLTLTYGLHYVRDTGRVDSNLGGDPTFNMWAPGLGNPVRTPNTNFAPQLGFAWNTGGNGKTVIRGGGGLYFENSLWNNLLFDSPARLKNGMFSYTPEVCSSGNPSAFAWPTNPGIVGTPVAGGAGIVVAGTNQVQPTFCGGTISTVASDILALSSAFKGAAAANVGSQPNSSYIGTALNASNVSGINVFDPNYRSPRSWQMNLGFQHELKPGMVLSVDYVRNIGEHFLLAIDKNHSGAARSYNMANAQAARDYAQLNAATVYGGAQNCLAGLGQAQCMITSLGLAGAQGAYRSAGLDSNNAVTGGSPCGYCAFPGITPNGTNNTGAGSGNGTLGTLDTFEPIGRSVYSGFQVKLVDNIAKPWRYVKTANFQVSYSYSKFISQVQDQDFVNLATNNDNPLQFTGPDALDRKHQISMGGTFSLPFSTRLSLIGHFYSPVPQNLQLPELTNGGEIFATDWLGSGLGSGASPEPVPGTQIGQFMRGTNIDGLQNVISRYNTRFSGQLTPAGHCLVADGFCPGAAPIQMMTSNDMQALHWVMPQIASVAPAAQGFTWLKTVDLKAARPFKIGERVTVEPSVSVFNVFNFANAYLPGNLPSASLVPGGPGNTLAPNAVGGVTGAALTPFRASFQSGTYALGAPRQFEFGLRIEF
jgi:hypothetical protein